MENRLFYAFGAAAVALIAFLLGSYRMVYPSIISHLSIFL